MNTTRRNRYSIILFLLIILPTTTHAQNTTTNKSTATASEIQDSIDGIIAAIATQLPDYGISSVMGAAPATTKWILTLHPNTVMQTLAIEEMDHPERGPELYTLINRYQAIRSAINGDSSQWTMIVKEEQIRLKIMEADAHIKEELDSLELQLETFHRKLETLRQEQKQISTGESNATSQISTFQNDIREIIVKLSTKTNPNEENRRLTKDLCYENLRLESVILSLSSATDDGIVLIESKINQARERASKCQGGEDSDFVKKNYSAAKNGLAIINQALVGAKISLASMTRNQNTIISLNNSSSLSRNKLIIDWNTNKSNARNMLSQTDTEIIKVNSDSSNLRKNLSLRIASLKAELVSSEKYYVPIFPKYAGQYSQLHSAVDSLISNNKLTNNNNSSLKNINSVLKGRLSSLKPPRNNEKTDQTICGSINKSKRNIAKIESVVSRANELTSSNADLANGCKKNNESKDNEQIGKDAETDSSTSPSPDFSDTQSESYGGLIISGPTSIETGQGVTYTATQHSGKEYPTGGAYTWINSREDLFNLGKSGRTVSGVGFKEGKVTIILKYDSMKAYLDVTIQNKPNIFGSTGGSKVDKNDSVFGSVGGQTANKTPEANTTNNDDCVNCDDDQITFDNDDDCKNIKAQLVGAINGKQVLQAESLRNRAVLMGCDIDITVVNGYINNIKHEQTVRNSPSTTQRNNNINQIAEMLHIFDQFLLNNKYNNNHRPRPNKAQAENHSHPNKNTTKKNYNYQQLQNFGNANQKGGW